MRVRARVGYIRVTGCRLGLGLEWWSVVQTRRRVSRVDRKGSQSQRVYC